MYSGKAWAKKGRRRVAVHRSNPLLSTNDKSDDAHSNDKASIDKGHGSLKAVMEKETNGSKIETKRMLIGQDLVEWCDENDVNGCFNASRREKTTGLSKESNGSAEQTLSSETADSISKPDIESKYCLNANRRSQPSKLPLRSRALALDTRFLHTPESTVSTVGFEIVQQFSDFFLTLTSRGASPCLLSFTKPDTSTVSSNPKQRALPVKVQVLDLDVKNTLQALLEKRHSMIPSVGLKLSMETNSSKSEGSTIPKALAAKYSWKILGNMSKLPLRRQPANCYPQTSHQSYPCYFF